MQFIDGNQTIRVEANPTHWSAHRRTGRAGWIRRNASSGCLLRSHRKHW